MTLISKGLCLYCCLCTSGSVTVCDGRSTFPLWIWWRLHADFLCWLYCKCTSTIFCSDISEETQKILSKWKRNRKREGGMVLRKWQNKVENTASRNEIRVKCEQAGRWHYMPVTLIWEWKTDHSVSWKNLLLYCHPDFTSSTPMLHFFSSCFVFCLLCRRESWCQRS